MPFEDARQQQVHERALRIEGDLVHLEERGARALPVVGRSRAAVRVDDDAEVGAHLPQRVVDPIRDRRHPRDVGRQRGEQDAAAQPVLLDPAHVVDRVVDVVQEDLPDPGTPLRELAAPVDEPAVVCAYPRKTVLVGLRGGLRREEDKARKEGWHRVREDHFPDDVVALLVTISLVVVPIPDAIVVRAEVLVRVLVLVAPRVEVVEVFLGEILAVHRVTRAGMAVGRDDRVVIGGLQVGRIERGRRHRWSPVCGAACPRWYSHRWMSDASGAAGARPASTPRRTVGALRAA